MQTSPPPFALFRREAALDFVDGRTEVRAGQVSRPACFSLALKPRLDAPFSLLPPGLQEPTQEVAKLLELPGIFAKVRASGLFSNAALCQTNALLTLVGAEGLPLSRRPARVRPWLAAVSQT